MKHSETVKQLEIRAVDAVHDLLDDVPRAEIESVEYERKVGAAYGVDGLIRFEPCRSKLCARRRGKVERSPPFCPVGSLPTRELRGATAPIRSSERRPACGSHSCQSLPVDRVARHLHRPRCRLSRSFRERATVVRRRLYRACCRRQAPHRDPCATLHLHSKGGSHLARPAARSGSGLARCRTGRSGQCELRPCEQCPPGPAGEGVA